MSLDDITRQLGEAYDKWKTGEKEKNKLRDDFFNAATEELDSELPAQRVSVIDAGSEEQARRIAQRRFHKFNITDLRQIPGEDRWEVVVEEEPALRGFSYLNREDGRVYSRQLVEGTPLLDDEAIRDEDPELWERISKEVVTVTREVIPLDELSDEEVAAIQPYIFMPKPTVKLAAPRKAKPEELDESSE